MLNLDKHCGYSVPTADPKYQSDCKILNCVNSHMTAISIRCNTICGAVVPLTRYILQGKYTVITSWRLKYKLLFPKSGLQSPKGLQWPGSRHAHHSSPLSPGRYIPCVSRNTFSSPHECFTVSWNETSFVFRALENNATQCFCLGKTRPCWSWEYHQS